MRLLVPGYVIITALLMWGVSACGDSPDQQSQSVTPAAASITDATSIVQPGTGQSYVDRGAILVDVRTADEFRSGHLRGALNIDLAAPDFANQIDTLDRTASYVVYCASGNRAGQAIELMVAQGFAQVVNGGGYDAHANSTSIPLQPG